jgi:hypothetical protein
MVSELQAQVKRGLPKTSCFATKISDYRIRDFAFSIRKENHNWPPKFKEASTERPQKKIRFMLQTVLCSNFAPLRLGLCGERS